MLDERSVTWRYAGDVRGLLFLGRAFLLQVMHPTIGAGVGEHSNFRTDPWGRLHSSFDLVLQTIYGPHGESVGAEVREAHRSIKGFDPHGQRYSAYEPEAYFWVLATGVDSVFNLGGRWFAALAPAEERQAYDETRELGRRFGLRDRDMPEDLTAFREWYATIVEERLEDNPTVRDFLEVISGPPPPRAFPRQLWPPLRLLGGHVGWLVTVGTAPARVRERLEIPWSGTQEAELSALSRALRTFDAMPARLRYLPPAREAFARARMAKRARAVDVDHQLAA